MTIKIANRVDITGVLMGDDFIHCGEWYRPVLCSNERSGIFMAFKISGKGGAKKRGTIIEHFQSNKLKQD